MQALLGDEALSMQRLEGSSGMVMIPGPTSITAGGWLARLKALDWKSAAGLRRGTGLLFWFGGHMSLAFVCSYHGYS